MDYAVHVLNRELFQARTPFPGLMPGTFGTQYECAYFPMSLYNSLSLPSSGATINLILSNLMEQ